MATLGNPDPESATAVEASRSADGQQTVKRSRPNKTLPSDRISFAKQLDVLRAYVAASAGGTRPCSLSEVAAVVRFNPNTVSLANPFYTSIGLIQRTEGGFLPNADVLSFQQAYEWDAETAPQKLAPTLREQWFFEALSPRLSFGALDEDAAIAILAENSGSGPEYKTNLRLLLEYLSVAALIIRDGGQVKPSRTVQPKPVPNNPEGSDSHHSPRMSPPAPKGASGKIQINVSIDVDMTQLAVWQPDRIASFFAGIAQVIAAKGGDKVP